MSGVAGGEGDYEAFRASGVLAMVEVLEKEREDEGPVSFNEPHKAAYRGQADCGTRHSAFGARFVRPTLKSTPRGAEGTRRPQCHNATPNPSRYF